MTALEQRDPRHDLVAEVRSERVREQILAVLPSDVPFASFERAAIRALLTNADIVKADRLSLMRALIDCAYMGLPPDGKHAALVIYGNQAQALPMVAGIITSAAAYGWHMRANVAYTNDEFEWSDEPPEIIHRAARPGTPRGELAYAYALALHRDGRRQQIVFDKTAVEKRKAKARTKNVWNEWAEEMWKKTAAHRLFKELPLDENDKRVALIAGDLSTAEKIGALYGPHATPALNQGSPATTPPADGGAEPVQPSGPGADAPQHDTGAADPTPVAPDYDDAPGPSDAEQIAALNAAKYAPKSQTWPAGTTIGQIYNDHGEKGREYLRLCVTGGAVRAEFVQALRDFTRVYDPELYALAMAEKA